MAGNATHLHAAQTAGDGVQLGGGHRHEWPLPPLYGLGRLIVGSSRAARSTSARVHGYREVRVSS